MAIPLSIRTLFASAIVLASAFVSAGSSGFGAKVTGGKGAKPGSVYLVNNFAQFKAALDNKGNPNAPKVIYIGTSVLRNDPLRCSQIDSELATDGILDGNYLPSGELASEDYYTQGTNYTFERYLDSFNASLKADLAASNDPAEQAYLALLNVQERERQKASKAQEKQISLRVGNNTSIEARHGAKTARIQNSYLAVNRSSNVIFRYVFLCITASTVELELG